MLLMYWRIDDEILQLKTFLTETDYIYPKCLELGLDVDVEYADVVAQRKLARTRIQELEVSTTQPTRGRVLRHRYKKTY